MSTHPQRLRVAAAVATLPLLLGISACVTPSEPVVATDTESVMHHQNELVPEGARWTQHYFPSSDDSDVELHADVLLPQDLDDGEKVPVILSVGAYFAHGGEVKPDPELTHPGPSDRFEDLYEGTDLFDRDYALVQVDLRGFGGSTGCLDFMGAGEQADVEAAIDWAASQPWSTGSVGMYGKSYDAVTGLVGNNLQNDALKAVVAQAPLWDPQTSIRSNGVPRSAMVDSSRSYNEAAVIPALPDDNSRYQKNAAYEAENPECTPLNSLGYQTADPNSEYWTTRDLAARAEGSDTPLLFTQGLLESITEPNAMEEFLTNHDGPERGWIGQWNHVRGSDLNADGKPVTGRDGWFDETMAFYDEYLKGIEPDVEYPDFVVQDSTGSWRAQDAWPVVDSTVPVTLASGRYVDDGAEGDPAVQTDNSYFTWSEPVTEATRITGLPTVTLNAEGHGNVMVKMYDVAPDGTGTVINDKVSTLAPGTTSFPLKSTDWTLPEGHSLAVEIGTIEAGAFSNWIDSPSNETITVSSAQLDLSLLDPANDMKLEGGQADYMATYLSVSQYPLEVQPGTFSLAE